MAFEKIVLLIDIISGDDTSVLLLSVVYNVAKSQKKYST